MKSVNISVAKNFMLGTFAVLTVPSGLINITQVFNQ